MKIGIVDIETTDFFSQNGKIVEIGIASLDAETGEVEIVFDSLCHETPITLDEVEKSWIVNNSSLKVNDVRFSPHLKDISLNVQRKLDMFEGVTAYNNQFDFTFLEDRGFRLKNKLDCPMKLLTPKMKLKGRGQGYKWPSVTEAYNYFFPDEPFEELHRGASDAKDEAKIVFEMIKRGWFKV